MIKYILKCKNSHEFESWFSDSDDYEKLKQKKLIECIVCDSKDVEKTIMSPGVTGISKKKKSSKINDLIEYKKKLITIRNYIEKNFENVGDKFSTKIRSLYYDQKNNKKIYGTTTEKERKELKEEGIELSSIPWLDKEN